MIRKFYLRMINKKECFGRNFFDMSSIDLKENKGQP